MKRIIAFLLFAALMLSVLSVGASALFEPMNVEEMKEALDAEVDGKAKGQMAFAWDFADIDVEDKVYLNDVEAEIANLVKGGRYSYTVESEAQSAQRGIEGLIKFGEFVRKSNEKSANVYKFESVEAADAYYQTVKDGIWFSYLCGEYVLIGDEALISSVAESFAYDAVKHADYTGVDRNILGDAFASVVPGSVGGIQFKTPDAAIRYENSEIVIGKAYKDYNASSYKSTDAYMDVYATGVSYNQAHEATAGKSFVLTASVRAPYSFDSVSGTMEIFRTRLSTTSPYFVADDNKTGKLTIDTILVKYNITTKEVTIYSAGKEIRTGIYLSDLEYTTLAVHVNPKENSYDFYADGILVAKNVPFLPESQIRNIVPAQGANPSGDLADYTLTRLRLFYTSVKTLTGDILCVDDFAWYYSDEYLEKAEYSETVIARSVELKECLYYNFYLNVPRFMFGEYENVAYVRLAVGETVTERPVMSGKIVESGEYKGLVKHSFPVSFLDIGKETKLSFVSSDGRVHYIYSPKYNNNSLCATAIYSSSVLDYMKYLLDDENGFDDGVKRLVRAALNYAAYIIKNEFKGNLAKPQEELPNYGYAYSAEELDAISADSLSAAVQSALYKEYVRFGDVYGLKVLKNSLVCEDTTYISITYEYTSSRTLTINGVAVKPSADGKYEHRIYINDPRWANDVFTVEFNDGYNSSIIKVSPYHLAANVIKAPTSTSGDVECMKVLYLYSLSVEEYVNSRV